VLEARQRDGIFDPFPIHDDVVTFDGHEWRGRVDIVTAGFPCQPFSVAGKQRGADDERNMWPDTARILREVRPRWALLENVPGLLTSGYFGRILGDLAEAGFDAAWCVLGARHVGAPHKRDRLWICCHLPDADSQRGHETARIPDEGRQDIRDADRSSRSGPCAGEAVADGVGHRLQGEQLSRPAPTPAVPGGRSPRWWRADPADVAPSPASQSNVGRVADGVADRKHRLKALGNGWVPQVACLAWRHLSNILMENAR
jgi:DNA (cytosine-5)-methyltransferase 1